MKKILLPILADALLAGCATVQPIGVVLTDVQLPVAVSSSSVDASKLKVGSAKCQSILAIVAQGDASIAAACKNGNIKKIHAVDWKAKNILGVIGEYECIVYGE